jgi:hypothetical protein
MEIPIQSRSIDAASSPAWLHRLKNYEYWPFWFFYLPMVPVWLWHSLRTGTLSWFTATNTNIEHGGFFGESKIDILRQIPEEYRVPSIFVAENSGIEDLKKLISDGWDFPLVAKPNVGERGFQVEVLRDFSSLLHYHQQMSEAYILQPYLLEPFEFGILYVRFPGEKQGTISSVTMKDFMAVRGDGKSSIKLLLESDNRYRLYLSEMQAILGENGMNEILAEGEYRLLQPIGNHCRGTLFVNANHLRGEKLDAVFNQISNKIDGLYFGRFDLKVSSPEDLLEGKGIRIMELNGASSEPGHIYDQSHGLIKAYRDLLWHWNALGKIARINLKNGLKPSPVSEIIQLLKKHFQSA